jgi:hypothetical protein
MTLPRCLALCLLLLAGCTEGQKPSPLSRSPATTPVARPADLNLHPIPVPGREGNETNNKH